MPLVSVIMPAFNAEAYIGRAIESVLRQTWADLELVIVDDGSSDGTLGIARAFAGRDPRVKVLQQPNAGPGPARNTAFGAAEGRLLAFLDSDDEWDDTFLAEHVALLDARPDVDVLIGNARNRGGSRDNQPARPVEDDGQPISLARMLENECALFIMTVFRRTVIDAVGGFDPALFTNEEYDLWIRASLAGFRFARHPKPLGWYSCRPDSLSSSDTRMLSGILRVFAKTRPEVPAGSRERAILNRQVARFEAELLAAEARNSLSRGDALEAGRQLTALHARRGGWKLWLASRATTIAPSLALAAYGIRKDGLTARSVVRAARSIDQTIGQWIGPRRALGGGRNSLHDAVLEPSTTARPQDPRIAAYQTAERMAEAGDRLARKPAGRAPTPPP